MSGLPTFPADPASSAAPVCRRDVALGPLTTFGVPAVAHRLFVLDRPESVDRVLRAVADLPAEHAAARAGQTGPGIPPRPFVLGGGSNLLLARDLDEPVLLVRLRGRHRVADDRDTVIVEVAAGEIWHDTVRWTLENGWYGLENLVLIPGQVGAAPWQNIGAYGVDVAERIVAVDAVHLRDARRRRFGAAECGFGYRSSVFKTEPGRDWLIVSVRLQLSRRPALRTGYGEIGAELARQAADAPSERPGTRDREPGPLDVARAVEAIRRRKLPDPSQIGNAGSFFKNPVVDAAEAERIAAANPGLPRHPATGQRVKLSAGWLIEAAGWKGHRDGNAGVSAQHALVIVNHGGASGRELVALARRIQASVLDRFGVSLEPEPVIVE